MKGIALAALALVLAVPAWAASPVADSAGYVKSRELFGGGFAEPGDFDPSLRLTARAALGLRAAGSAPSGDTRDYLEAQSSDLDETADVALVLAARAALGDRAPALVARLRADTRPGGAIGPSVDSTIWAVLALRQARADVPRATTRFLLARQARSGGWADANGTAAAVQALRSVGVRGRPIARALAFLRRHQNPDGGFELTRGRGSDAQTTAAAIQAFLAAGARPGAAAYRFLARLRRPDGSYRSSSGSQATAPVWVTSNVLPALARRPLPLR